MRRAINRRLETRSSGLPASWTYTVILIGVRYNQKTVFDRGAERQVP